MTKLKVLNTILIMLITATAQAAAYKWVDDKGNIHYSDRAPNGVRTELAPPPDKVRNTDHQDRMKSLIESQKKTHEERQAQKKEQQQKMAEKNKFSARCEKLRQRQTALTNKPARKTFTKTDDGNMRRLTEEEKQSRLDNIKKQLKEFCD